MIIKKGDYVLATKYSDGDPGDPWGVGFYDSEQGGRHYIVNSNGKQIRGGGYRRAGLITSEFGHWLLESGKTLESSPPGSVNLWGMQGVRATPQDDEQ